MDNIHEFTLDFGKHKGSRIVNVPVNYLRWMVNVNSRHADMAKAEMERRGTVVPEIEISGHATNRASLTCIQVWYENSQEDEGLHAWLCRVSMEAIEKGERRDDSEKIWYMGMKFAITKDTVWPVLLTVNRVKN